MAFRSIHYRIALLLVIAAGLFSLSGFTGGSAASDDGYVPGQTYYGSNDYVEYIAGDLPIIFSAPHGGYLEPEEIPDRTWGTTVMDLYTLEMARAVFDAVHDYTGRYPHVIISHLRRTKLDPNRDITEAAQGNQYAEQAWHEYHGFIDSAKADVTREFGKGFYVDLHGHGHDLARLELGYLLSSSVLELTDAQLDQYASQSSIRAIAGQSSLSFSELIRGEQSLGTLFHKSGYLSVPSEYYPDPGGYSYFSGGYSTKQHGSRYGGTISGVQIEMPKPGVRDTDENRRWFAQKLTQVLDTYLSVHLGIEGYITTGVAEPEPALPSSFRLRQNYPNPFNASTKIMFDLPVSARIKLEIYTITGQRAAVLADSQMPAGTHAVTWTAQGSASGVYFIAMTSGNHRILRKCVLLK